MGANFDHDEPDDNHSKPNRLRPFTHIHAHSRTFSCRSSFITRGRTKYKTQTFLNVDQKQQEAGRRKQQQQRAGSGQEEAGRKQMAGSRWEEAPAAAAGG